jgi:RNA polymerase sigma-70 factor (ECF subfamily)
MNGDEDSILVRQFKGGDEKSFDRLYDKYHLSLYTLCYRFVRNESDARELVQDVFIKIYRNLAKFNERSKFFTWAYRIAVNTCISFKRAHKVRMRELSEKQSSLSMDKRIHMKIAIDDALSKVPKRQRMCFLLHHYEGYTFSEIGVIMSITTGAAKANHHHAVRKLRELLGHVL